MSEFVHGNRSLSLANVDKICELINRELTQKKQQPLKTEHHANRAIRILPLLPAIETELLKLFAEAEEGAEYVFPNIQADTNLRKGLTIMIRRAGVMLWQNLRASGSTDFAKNLPSHVAAAICGHTEQIAQEHYWTITDGDLDTAMDKLSQKLATKLATIDVLEGLESSPTVSDSEDQETKKAPIIQGFDEICRLMSSLGILTMDDIGLEIDRFHQVRMRSVT